MNTWAGDTPNCGGTYREHWEKNGIPVSVVHKYTDTHIYTHTPIPTSHTDAHMLHTHRPETHILVVGVKKPDGQVVLLHWTHGEGTHQPVGKPMNEPIQENISCYQGNRVISEVL